MTSGWLVVVAAMAAGVAVAGVLPVRLHPPATAGRRAPAAGVPAAPSEAATDRRPLRGTLSLAAGLGAVLLVGGPPGILLGLVVAVMAWRALGRVEPAAVRRRRERLVRSLPHVVDLLASSLAVGASPTSAVEIVASAVDPPIRDELALVAARLGLGMDPVRVWAEVARHPQLGALGRCLVRAIDSGASVSEAMHGLAEDLRRGARAEVEARARAVAVKAAAPLGLCLLPAFILTGIVPLVAGSVEVLLLGR